MYAKKYKKLTLPPCKYATIHFENIPPFLPIPVKKSCLILMSHEKTFLHGLKVHGKFFKIVGQKDGLTGRSIRNGLVSAKNM